MIVKFLLYLSWTVLPISILICLLSIYATEKYKGSVEEIRDKLQGTYGTWPIYKSAIFILLSSIYLITYYNQ